MNEDYREIYTSPERFDQLRSDPKFAKLLNLARAVNAIYFCLRVLLDHGGGDTTPSGQRQYINAFLFSAGALHEAFAVADSLERHFGDRDSYRNGFGKLLKDPKTKVLRATILRRLRNKLVFHYDEDVARKGLKTLGLDSYIFASAVGDRRSGTYYNLADEIVLNHLLGDSDGSDEDERLGTAAKDIADALSKFVHCADELMAGILSDDIWEVRRGKVDATD